MRETKPLGKSEGKGIAGADHKPAYVPPKIVTYDKDQLTEIIGPAMACGSTDSCPSGYTGF